MSLARAAALTADRLVPSITRALSDPTDLLHYWSPGRAPARGSSLNAVTLYRVSDAAQGDFAFDARGRLPLSAIQTWAGSGSGTTQVRVARVWDSSATQLGPERVTNGGFASGTTGWTNINGTDEKAEDGRLKFISAAAANPNAFQSNVFVIGKTYRVSYTVLDATAGAVWLSDGVISIIGGSASTVNGNYASIFVASNTMLQIKVNNWATISITNISVSEVLTANAVQTTVSSMPFLDLATGGILGTSGSSLVATLPAQVADAKIVLANQAGVAVTTATVNSGAYTVQSASQLRERVILKADTPDADVEKVKRALMRYWKLPEAA